MSADRPGWSPQAPESWKLSLPITRAQADRLAGDGDEFEAFEPTPVVVVSEPDQYKPDDWQLDVYFEGRPQDGWIAQIRASVGNDGGTLERLEDADWVTISQAWLEPIRAGRFHVHTAAHAEHIPADAIAFRIEASRAFGTGHHETTRGCLALLSAFADEGLGFSRIADIGTGTGLLAFAARALWPDAHVVATDIDPVAIPVVAENMAVNAIPGEAIVVAVADGTDHPALREAPFDLVTANILAGPLIELSADMAQIVASGGRLVLAGLLATQERDVLDAYETQGFALANRRIEGDWPVLALSKLR